MSIRLIRPIAAVCFVVSALLLLNGCAEFNRRGGFVEEIGDKVLFPARTKSHRLLRAYVLTAALATIARNVGMGDVEKQSVGGRLRAALDSEQEAYNCLYPSRARLDWLQEKLPRPITVGALQPTACVFFDERMARIEYAVYKLAADVMIDPDSQSLFTDVRNRLIADIPVVGSGVRTVTKALDTTKEATNAVSETTSLADSIINLSIKASPRWVYLTPIYRDALELDMRLVLDALRERCSDPTRPQDVCTVYDNGVKAFNEGDGNLRPWREFLGGEGPLLEVQAYPVHFELVTRWFFDGCAGLYAGGVMKPGKFSTSSTTDTFSSAVITVERAVDQNCSPLIEYFRPTFGGSVKIAYRPRNGDTNEHNVNAKRAPLPAERPAVPAAAKLPAGADKARGEEK